MDIQLKRAYETPDGKDGYRALVDRLWPRGVSKAEVRIDEWWKAGAPSPELRKWFNHEPARFERFEDRYLAELESRSGEAQQFLRRAGGGRITLVYAARDPGCNHAVILRQFLLGIGDDLT